MRSARQAYGVGLVHGLAGSAGVGVLLLAGIPDAVEPTVALLLFACFTAVSMAGATTLFGIALSSRGLEQRTQIAPALGVLGLAFGVWYVLGAVDVVPYML